jgi:hypothetical protein
MEVMRPGSVALTGSRARTRARGRLLHRLVGVASWIALGALWAWQLEVFVPASWLRGVEMILALGAAWACFSVAWVAWCRSIYRRRHRRTTPLRRDVELERDALGRPIIAPADICGGATHVIVSVGEGGVKHYQPAYRAAGLVREPLVRALYPEAPALDATHEEPRLEEACQERPARQREEAA